MSFMFLVIHLNSLLMIVKTTYSEDKLVKQNDNNQEHIECDSIENRSCSWFSKIQFWKLLFIFDKNCIKLAKYIILWNPKKLLQLPISCTFSFNQFAFINWSFILRRSQNWQYWQISSKFVSFLQNKNFYELFLYILPLIFVLKSESFIKVHIFWEGHKILQNLHLTFVCMYSRQK